MTSETLALARKIHPTAIIDQGADIGPGVEIGPYCLIGPDVVIGEGVKMIAHVQIMGRTQVGAECEIHPFAVIGGAPQIANYSDSGETALTIGPKCVIREHVTLHRGSARGHARTKVGANCLFMVGCHIAHDCDIGDHVILANNVALGGHCILEDYAFLGGLAAVHQFTRIGKHAFVGGLAPVGGDVIPYGMIANDGYLDGLNVVGLRRRGFDREQIRTLRLVYRVLFAPEGTMQERLQEAAQTFAASREAQDVIAFIRAGDRRPLSFPRPR